MAEKKGLDLERIPVEQVFEQLKCTKEGLTTEEGEQRLKIFGPNKPFESRILAGIVLKNSLDAKDAAWKEQLLQQWMSIDVTVKSQIKDLLLNTHGSSAPEARHNSAQVIAEIAAIEIPMKSWPGLIESLLVNMTQQDRAATLKQATLETLGYACEISHQDLGQDEVNSVLTAVVQGMNLAEHGPEVRPAATKALYNALHFAETNFENEMERNYIMKMVCETAMTQEAEIRQATYYHVLEPYMLTLFELTSNAVKGYAEAIALQPLEFWSSICDEEIELQAYEAAENGDSESPNFHFMEKALSSLVPMSSHIIAQLLPAITSKLGQTLELQTGIETYTEQF